MKFNDEQTYFLLVSGSTRSFTFLRVSNMIIALFWWITIFSPIATKKLSIIISFVRKGPFLVGFYDIFY